MVISRNLGTALSLAILLSMTILMGCSSNDDDAPVVTPTSAPTIELPEWTGDPVVQTVYGPVEGFDDQVETLVWKAIPFASPPVGELRWKAPRDPEPWETVREAKEFCGGCAQYLPSMTGVPSDTTMGNEDCLYLNVWRPQSEEKGLPVYVWIHGGGNSIGASTLDPGTYGANLAGKSDMVFISLNYRIGPLGWFTHPALRTGDPLDNSGNFGTLDIIKGLEWVRDNIKAFGGDPDNVMVSGISAGGMNILSLLISPLAHGLFDRALVQSGMKVSVPIEQGEASARSTLLTLLLNDGTAADLQTAEAYADTMSDSDIATYLRSKSPGQILDCYDQMGFGMLLFPYIFQDGTVILAEGFQAFKTGEYPNKIPLMIGNTKEESKMFLFMDPSFEGKDDLYQAVASYGSDLWKAAAVDDVARELTSHPDQPDVYVYQFAWGAWRGDAGSVLPPPYGFKLGACHSLDVPFFLGTATFNFYMTDWVFSEENRPGREALSDAMMAYEAQFARTGSPDQPEAGLVAWEPWTNGPDEPRCLILDADKNSTNIQMSSMELTRESVLESMASNLPEPLYSEAMDYMSSTTTISHLLEEME